MSAVDIGIVGIGNLTENIITHLTEKKYSVCLFNTIITKKEKTLIYESNKFKVVVKESLKEFVETLKVPRKILLLDDVNVNGDITIDELVQILNKNDIIIDGGGTKLNNCIQRCKRLKENNILYIEFGIFEGENDFQNKYSFIFGGSIEAWKIVKPIFQDIAFKNNTKEPCCDLIGPEGAGHLMKIMLDEFEYSNFEMILESYHLMKDLLNMTEEEIFKTFEEWNVREPESLSSNSFSRFFKLINANSLRENKCNKSEKTYFNQQMGIISLDNGVPAPLYTTSVFNCKLNDLNLIRFYEKQQPISNTTLGFYGNKKEFLQDIKSTYEASKIILFSQGLLTINFVSQQNEWNSNPFSVAWLWKGEHRSNNTLLRYAHQAFERDNKLSILFFYDFFQKEIQRCVKSWRNVVSNGFLKGIPIPMFSSAIAFYDGFRTNYLPANLIQAQRDYFGAHQYCLLNNPNVSIHTDWTKSKNTASSGHRR